VSGGERPWAGRRLHLIGIGGAGMSGYALAAAALGAEVTGSDRTESPALERLRAAGVRPVVGHDAANVPDGAEVVYSTAVPEDNPERVAARERGLPELPRAELLGQLGALRRVIAVAGTHGKTTTSSMVAHILLACGLDPGYLIGGDLRTTGTNAAWGTGEWLVVEADESDRSFLALRPEVAVLTNAELDHHATYGSELEVRDAFRAFLAPAEHAVVWARPELLALAPEGADVVPFDVPEPVSTPEGVAFAWRGLEARLAVPGAHNARNAAAALECARLAGADPAEAVAALRTFAGAGRRFEALGRTARGADIVDDYAHHPTEVRATLEAARSRVADGGRLVAVFQPHLYSRTWRLAGDFGRALALADVVAVLDVYPARERAEDFPGVTGRLVAEAAYDAAGGRPVLWLPGFDDAERVLAGLLRPGDLCLTLGAGDVVELGRRLADGQGP
jgi:UDP-N-acetylmuramate--alanine ligase